MVRSTALLLCTFLLGVCSRSEAAPEHHTGVVSGRITVQGRGVPATVKLRERLPKVPHVYNVWRQAAHLHRRLASLPRVSRPWREIQARSDGWFRIDSLAPACYDLHIETDDGHWGGAAVPVIVAGQHVEIDVPLLTSNRSVRGYVRHADGRPHHGYVAAYQGGIHTAFGDDPDTVYERRTMTDSEGAFHIRGLGPGPIRLVAHVPGVLWQHSEPIEHAGKDLEFNFVLDGGANPLRGVVLDIETRKPIGGARLTWLNWWDGSTTACGVVISDADGRFVVPQRTGSPRVEDLHVHAPGYGRRRYEYPRRDGTFIAYMRKAARIEGRVVDEQGHGVARVHVRVKHRAWQKRGSSRPLWSQQMQVGMNAPVLTDESGHFVHEDLDWGDIDLYARGRGWVPAGLVATDRWEDRRKGQDRRPHTLLPGETLAITLRVERGAVLRGVLTDQEGRPVAGVPLTFDSDGDDPLFEWRGYERPPLAATDAEGRFAIHGLLPGSKFELHAMRQDYPKVVLKAPALTRKAQPPVKLVGLGPTRFERAPVPKSEPAPKKASTPGSNPAAKKPRSTTAAHGRWILLHVIDAKTRKPIQGAHVHAMMNTSLTGSERFEIEWHTDENGHARLGPFGDLTGGISVGRAAGYIDRHQIGFGMPTPEGKPMTVMLERAHEIRGRVLLPDGRPAAGGRVDVRNLDGGGSAHYRGAAKIGPDGYFRKGGHIHASVRYEVTVSYWDDVRGYRAKRTVLGADGPLVLRLEPIPGSKALVEEQRKRLRIRVLGPDGRPVPRATITLGRQSPETFEDGVAVFGSPVTADDELRIWRAAAEDGWPFACGPLRMAKVGKAKGDLVVQMPPERFIAGVLKKPDGSPMPGVGILARVAATTDPKRPQVGLDHGSDQTDKDGRFRIRRLGDELYELRFDAPEDLLPPTPHLRIKPSDKTIAVVLRTPITVRLRVLDKTGNPLPQATVHAGFLVTVSTRWQGPFEMLSTTSKGVSDTDGYVTLEGLDADAHYRLELRVKIDEKLTWMGRDGWKPLPGTIEFKPEDR